MLTTAPHVENFISDVIANDNVPICRHVVHADDLPIETGFGPQYGGATWKTLISSDRMESAEVVLGVAQIPAGGVLAPHRHPPAEFYFVMSGSGVVMLEGVANPVTSGSAVFIPGNAEHSFEAGPEGVSFAYGFAQNAFSDVEYTFSE